MAAAVEDGGRPTGRPVDDDFTGCLAAAGGCLAVVAARGFSTAAGFSTAGFVAAVLFRSFFGDAGGEASMLLAGSGAGCTVNTNSETMQCGLSF